MCHYLPCATVYYVHHELTYIPEQGPLISEMLLATSCYHVEVGPIRLDEFIQSVRCSGNRKLLAESKYTIMDYSVIMKLL